MSAETRCPLCGKDVGDILKHFVLVHDIENLEHLNQEVRRSESAQKRQREFSVYVTALQERRKKNLISAEQYRELVSRWLAAN